MAWAFIVPMRLDMNVEIRPFSIEVYDAVFALWQKCDGIGLSQADSREGIQRYLRRNPGMSFIARSGDAVVGAVLAGHDGRRGFIHHLAVDPGCRRRSVGRRLLERCLQSLAQAGIQKCHLFVMNHNREAIAFWQSVGWTARKDLGVRSRNSLARIELLPRACERAAVWLPPAPRFQIGPVLLSALRAVVISAGFGGEYPDRLPADAVPPGRRASRPPAGIVRGEAGRERATGILKRIQSEP